MLVYGVSHFVINDCINYKQRYYKKHIIKQT